MRDNEKIYRLIGLARRAGRLSAGETAAMADVKAGKAYLVIVAGDASANTAKLFKDKCAYRSVPLIRFGEKEELGKATGKAAISVIALTDEGFAKSITGVED